MKRHEIIKMLEKFEMIDVNGSLGIPPKQYNSLAYEIEQLTLTGVGCSLDFDKLRKQFNDILKTFDDQKIQDWLDKKS